MTDEHWTFMQGMPAPSCPKCGATMKDVVTIAPVAGEPGLVAYECPVCRHVTSVIVQPRSSGESVLS